MTDSEDLKLLWVTQGETAYSEIGDLFLSVEEVTEEGGYTCRVGCRTPRKGGSKTLEGAMLKAEGLARKVLVGEDDEHFESLLRFLLGGENAHTKERVHTDVIRFWWEDSPKESRALVWRVLDAFQLASGHQQPPHSTSDEEADYHAKEYAQAMLTIENVVRDVACALTGKEIEFK